ncbi:MAG: hypothetical protein SGPRY_001437 [Prymnesium sp.]
MLPLLFSLLAFTPDATPLARAPSPPTPRLVAKLSPHPLPRPSHTPLARKSAALVPALAALAPIAVGAVEPPFGVDTSFLASDEMKQLAVFLAQTLISWGVPGSLLILIIVLISGSKGDPTEAAAAATDGEDLPPPLAKILGMSKEPKEFLQVERLNGKLQSFSYSLAKAATSKEVALRLNERINFQRKFGAALASSELADEEIKAITRAAEKYRKTDGKLKSSQDSKLRELRALSLTMGATPEKGSKVDGNQSSGEGSGNPMKMLQGWQRNSGLKKEISRLMEQRLELEAAFLTELASKVPKAQVPLLVELLKSSVEKGSVEGGAASTDAMSAIQGAVDQITEEKKHVFVLKFNGDVTASQGAALRQEVTAVLGAANSSRGDEVVLVLNTGGGTVTGYGLAAAQLVRIKQGGLPLTICVEQTITRRSSSPPLAALITSWPMQVAASGGYMMACVADRLVASPFAVLGSIGVITEQPNVYDRLKREGIVFSTVTAGKYKRTLTPTKRIDVEDQKKLKEDIEQILVLFKARPSLRTQIASWNDFVKTNRPSLDIDEIATGETWCACLMDRTLAFDERASSRHALTMFGPDALKRGLVDELLTSDDLLVGMVHSGAEVYGLKYRTPPSSPLAAVLPGGTLPSDWRGVAIAALTRLAASSPAGASGLSEVLLRAQQEAVGGWGSDESSKYLAARPQGEVDPQLRWPEASDRRDMEDDSWPF